MRNRQRLRCPECNRWVATDEQWHKWMNWATYNRRIDGFHLLYSWRRLHNLAQPLWWRLDTTCLQWNDCPTQYPPGYRPVSWWVRRLFKVPESEWANG